MPHTDWQGFVDPQPAPDPFSAAAGWASSGNHRRADRTVSAR